MSSRCSIAPNWNVMTRRLQPLTDDTQNKYDGVRLKRFIKDEGEEINGDKWMKEQILNQNK